MLLLRKTQLLLITTIAAVIFQTPARSFAFSSSSSYHCSNSSVTYEAFASSFSDISRYSKTPEKDRTTPTLPREYIQEREDDSDSSNANHNHNEEKTSLQQACTHYLLPRTVSIGQAYGIIISKKGWGYPLYILFSSLKIPLA